MKPGLRKILFILTTIGISFRIVAQKPDLPDESTFFRAIRASLDESYITFGQGLGNLDPLIFEAQISPGFLLRTSRDARWGATLTPAVLIRMQAEESFPVRTPGYKPSITFYHQPGNKGTFDEKIRYVFLRLAHHSNGQMDPFYDSAGNINIQSGNFATNYLEAGAFFTHYHNRNGPGNSGKFFRISLEVHPGIDQSPELTGRYSMVRWHNQFRVFRTIPVYDIKAGNGWRTIQVTAKTTWMFGSVDDAGFADFSERLNASLNLEYKPAILNDVSFFANIYTGEDYYNIRFNRRITVLRIGLQAFSH